MKSLIKRAFNAIFGIILISGTVLILSSNASATLIGDSVQATMTGSVIVVTPFSTTPAVVGEGHEFEGVVGFPSDNLLAHLTVDVSASGFSVTGNSFGENPWSRHDGTDVLRIDLTDLDWVGSAGEIIGLNDLGGAHIVQSFGFGTNSAFVVFDSLQFSTSTRNFSFDVAHVPEPSTLAIFGLGLAGLGFMRRRRKLN